MEDIKRKAAREKHPSGEENIVPIQEVLEIEEKELKDIPIEVPIGIVVPKKDDWKPRTSLGKKVASGEITNIDDILDRGIKILEPEIIDRLLPDLTVELIEVGQSKGKFGGGKASIWKQTQKKTKEGNKLKFSTCALAGNKNGYVGIGFGGAKETVPAREKTMRMAKLNVIKVKRGCGDWSCGCDDLHSIPYKIEGKEGSVRLILSPAPKGAGLSIEKKCQKILQAAGIKDIYSKTFGQTKTKLNLIRACYYALKNLSQFRELPKVEDLEKVQSKKISSKNKK